ncbi:hypothetical protein BU23DRAFT_101946 [Bimuria novae-zelandiae CBS 107.79]|uniref:Heterokaryon incompatibility domain-containing protein n=1 Tax=Bimuria novae-zelandiae CBS 107.79 TaxID=1447943 RepID=A0A6A5VPP3_9PLEO|nr:hypothetical protein BU23DRAFT_101946 [Bimuria novae-zelandiae CBS 107.79]
MTRWHERSCTSPDVVVEDGGMPRCQSCEASCPSVGELITQQSTAGSSLRLPPDEPAGQMNLHWPPSVKYSGATERRVVASDTAKSPAIQEKTTTVSMLYGEALQSNELRLACLSAVSGRNAQIHVELEVYADDDHPEYECTSYTWGGEDNDNTKCRPIYMGTYWDVLLQTKNCHSMLQNIRPWRGVRMVWVDAICIDQSNMVERASQVAKMGQIYENCTRVIVYLGPDWTQSTRRFPVRQSLDSLQLSEHPAATSRSVFNLLDMLSRRYFSRVWVVQELLLSPRAIIRVGDTEFRADAEILLRMQEDFPTGWFDDCEAPWFQRLGQKSLTGSRSDDLYDLLRLTATSQASDPRDRVFGVIALAHSMALQKSFAPDYSLSFTHFFTGLFAHILQNDGRYWFLYRAGLASTRPGTKRGLPSWVPDCWRDQDWLRIISKRPTREKLVEHRKDMDRSTQPFAVSMTSRSHETIQKPKNTYFGIDSRTGALSVRLTHLFAFEEPLTMQVELAGANMYRFGSTSSRSGSWLVLISPELLKVQVNTDHLFLLEGGLLANCFSEPWTEYNPVVYLILRKEGTVPYRYSLVTSNVRLFTDHNFGDGTSQLEQMLPDLLRKSMQKGEIDAESWSLIGGLSVRTLAKVQYNVTTAMNSFTRMVSSLRYQYLPATLQTPHPEHLFLSRAWHSIFPGIQDPTELLKHTLLLCQAINMERDHNLSLLHGQNRESLLKSYFQYVGDQYQPMIEEASSEQLDDPSAYIQLTFSWHEWISRLREYYTIPESFGASTAPLEQRVLFEDPFRWNWRYESDKEWREADVPVRKGRYFLKKDRTLGRVFVRISRWRMLKMLGGTLQTACDALPLITKAYTPPLDSDSLLHMLENGPTEEQEYIGTPKYIGGVKIDGSRMMVNIV